MSDIFFHFSDLHIKQEGSSVIKFEKEICRYVQNLSIPYNNIFIVISGDIAFSGNVSEYENAMQLFENIKDSIQEGKHVYFLMVPGNHDCNFLGRIPVRENLLKTLKNRDDNIDTSEFDIFKEVQKEYLDFDKIYSPSDELKITEKPYCKIYSIKGMHKYNFFLFNSALFCEKDDKYGDVHFPLKELDELKDYISKDMSSINIAISHHPFNWQDDISYTSIKNFFERNFSMIFLGHEHSGEVRSVQKNGRKQFLELKGGILGEQNNQLGDFFAYKMNIASIEATQYLWDAERKVFIDTNIGELSFDKDGLRLKEDFYKNILLTKFLSNSPINIQLDRIYVPPLFIKIGQSSDNGKTKKVTSDEIFSSKTIYAYIKGDEKCGKTSFLKMFFLNEYNKGNVPIYINGDELTTSARLNIQNFLERKFKEEYEDVSGSEYEIYQKEKRSIFIDDIDLNIKLKDLYSFLNKLKEYSDKIVVSITNKSSDIFIDFSKESISFNDDYECLEVLELNNEKKQQLYKKWCDVNREQIDAKKLEIFLKNSDQLLKKGIVPSTPFYLLSMLCTFTAGSMSGLTAEIGCAEFYRSIIMTMLQEAAPDKYKASQYFNYIQYIAYHMLTKNKKVISETEFNQLTERYCREKMFERAPLQENDLTKSGVMIKKNDELNFSQEYIFYFFASKYLSENLEDQDVSCIIDRLFNSIYEKDSANIIVFLSYHSGHKFVLKKIEKKAKEIFDQTNTESQLDVWNSTSFVDSLVKELPKISVPEKKGVELQEERARVLDEYDEKKENRKEQKSDDVDRLIIEALKLTEIIGAILKNHVADISADDKISLIKYILLVHKNIIKNYMENIKQNSNELLCVIKEKMNEKKLNTNDINSVYEFGNRIIFYITCLIYMSCISHIKNSIINKDLWLIIEEISKDSSVNSKFFNLLKFSSKVELDDIFPMSIFRNFVEEYKDSKTVFSLIFTYLMVRYASIYYDVIKRETFDSIMSQLNIKNEIKKNILIESKKR